MMQNKTCLWLVSAVVCTLLLITGCAPTVEEAAKPQLEPEKQIPTPPTAEDAAKPEPRLEEPKPIPTETATLALKFSPQDLTTYRLTTEAQQTIKFEGSLPDDPLLKGGRKDNKIEMTFTQQIQSINNKGNAIAKITINSLKYSSKIKDNVLIDFDNSRKKDKNSPFAKLIGQSYTIEIAPTGRVLNVIDAGNAQDAVRGDSAAHKAASMLVNSEVIKGHHGLMVLPTADKNQLQTGNNFSRTKTFSFPMLGSKSYEKIYTLKEIKDTDNQQIATVEMKAIPTSGTAEHLHKEQQISGFSEMFDNIEAYTGQLKLDLATGKIKNYFEKLQSEWVMVDPEAKQKGDKEPV